MKYILRKWGALGKVFVGLCLFYGIYEMVTYSFPGKPKENPYLYWNNETGVPGQDVIVTNEKVVLAAQRPSKMNEKIVVPSPIKVEEFIPLCGLEAPCKNSEFAVHIYTGKDHNDQPRLCVDGKYILSKDTNGGGRGINAVVVDNVTRAVVRVSHFDTYEKESTALETLLLTLRTGDIIILLTFDEPTRKLSRVARLLLHELGSALIQNLSYRGSWYLVTQKGLTGFSPFEELHLVEASGWSQHHDVRFCVPLQLEGQPIHPDPIPRENKARQNFCHGHPDFPHFCDIDVINDPLFPAPFVKHAASTNKIYTTPILVMSGEDIKYLPLTLETLIRQSGINPGVVVVYYLPEHSEVPSLADLFGFMTEEFTQTSNYCRQVAEAFETASLLFPDAKEMLLIGEGVILAPDFLFYMGQLLPLLELDPTIHSISAWNDNGFEGVSGDSSLSYRVENFSGFAFMVRRKYFKKELCDGLSQDKLLFNLEIQGETIVPDISRVLYMQLNGASEINTNVHEALLARNRVTSYDEDRVIQAVEKLHHEEYEKQLNALLSTGIPVTLDVTSLVHCAKLKSSDTTLGSKGIADLIPFMQPNVTGQVYVVFYVQKDTNNQTLLKLLCHCFGLFYHPNLPPRGLHKGLLRFTWSNNQIFLVGSTSPYYRHKLAHVRPVLLEPTPGVLAGVQSI